MGHSSYPLSSPPDCRTALPTLILADSNGLFPALRTERGAPREAIALVRGAQHFIEVVGTPGAVAVVVACRNFSLARVGRPGSPRGFGPAECWARGPPSCRALGSRSPGSLHIGNSAEAHFGSIISRQTAAKAARFGAGIAVANL